MYIIYNSTPTTLDKHFARLQLITSKCCDIIYIYMYLFFYIRTLGLEVFIHTHVQQEVYIKFNGTLLRECLGLNTFTHVCVQTHPTPYLHVL